MTAYDYITFDPIGYLPFNRYSSIVSFKNVLLYKFLKDLEPDDYGNDQAHQENANQKIAKYTHTQCVFHIIRLRLIIFHTPKFF